MSTSSNKGLIKTYSSSATNPFIWSNGWGLVCFSGTSAVKPRITYANGSDWSSDESGSTLRPLKWAKGDEFLSKFLLFCFGLISHVTTYGSKVRDSLVSYSEQLSWTFNEIDLWISLKSWLKGRCCYFKSFKLVKLINYSSELARLTDLWSINKWFKGFEGTVSVWIWSDKSLSETSATYYININAAKSYNDAVLSSTSSIGLNYSLNALLPSVGLLATHFSINDLLILCLWSGSLSMNFGVSVASHYFNNFDV